MVMDMAKRPPTFYVFSDDISWCREHLGINNAVFVDLNSHLDPAEDFRLMRGCQHFITTNSGLSWWAALLAEHPAAIKVAPKYWLRDHENSISPPEWLRAEG